MKIEIHLWRIANETKKILVKKFKIKGIKDFRPMAKNSPHSCDSLGYCTHTGQIRVAIRDPHTKQLLPWGEIIDTVCHELAHLKQLTHRKKWCTAYKEYLAYIRSIL